ncbi:MAG: SHOCT domain-containing protein [Actinobacteria bacterium]|nr:MAG: SHOCT domain-containing protein [Actinomycetota bacterium]
MMGYGYGPGGMMGGYGFGLLGGLLMMLFFLLIVVGGVLLVIWLVRQSSQRPGPSMGGADRALVIARERYAKGEISKEEFDKIERDLR